jgi:serine O-acetyltransferase
LEFEMPEPATSQPSDPIWTAIRAEAWSEDERDAVLRKFLKETILKSRRLEEALSLNLATKLGTEFVYPMILRELIDQAFEASPALGAALRNDLQAIRDRDPASKGFLAPFLYFKGFHALSAYRVANWLWYQHRQLLAVHLQNRISEVFGVDIHPAARIGSGVLIDHGTGVVIGETAIVEDNVSILHGVTLGGTGKETGDRHPKVRRGVLIGAGASILGNIEIGAGAKIAASSVVLDPVPPKCTVAGVPARIVGRTAVEAPALEMDQQFPHKYDGEGI